MISADAVGATVAISKTVGEYDVYAFAGVSGDFSPNHVDAEYMKQSPYGERIVHGALLIGYMSTASVAMINKLGVDAVTYGYDRIRFPKAAVFGDTITVTYQLVEVLDGGRRSHGKVTATTQNGDVVAVATHILHCFDKNGMPDA